MTLDPTAVVDASHEYHIVFTMEQPHKGYFIWRGKLCDCEPGCIISAGFGHLPSEPWTRFSVLIPSALRPGQMQTYCYSSDPKEVARLIAQALHEEHTKGCIMYKRKRKLPVPIGDSSVVESDATPTKVTDVRKLFMEREGDVQPPDVGEAAERGHPRRTGRG